MGKTARDTARHGTSAGNLLDKRALLPSRRYFVGFARWRHTPLDCQEAACRSTHR